MWHGLRVAAFSLAFVSMVFTPGQPASEASGAMPLPPGTAPQVEVPVQVVVLFSSGVGYFEHAGTVTGHGSTELRFKTDQINDILKSLVLEDLDGGRVATVVYPSQDPLSKTLRSFQVDISANPSLGELLNQLRGAKVRISAQAEQIGGTILGLERKQKSVGDKAEVIASWMLNLISGGTLRAVALDEIQRVELEDAQVQEELHKALLALSQGRDQNKKPVIITFQGEGERGVRLGYVVGTPIWKTSYRLILPANREDKAKLQGWAIVENQTDNDWNDVALTLVSGRPISFVQELYSPLYLPRPVVKPELYGSLRPPTYEAGVQEAERQMSRRITPQSATRAEETQAMRRREAESALAGSPAAKPLDPTASVASMASAGVVGELFQYVIGNVSLPRQRSAMLPIVTDDIEVERVSIYNQGVLAKHPLNGARLKNTTGKHLLQGPVTVLDAHIYAGDARIDNLPPGQERLLSYAIDLQVRINATQHRQESLLQAGKLVKGVLHLTRKQVFTQEYVVENKADKDRLMIIEHPFRAGWKLVDSPKPMESTETLYRFKEAVTAGKAAKVAVKEEIVQGETLAILPADIGQLEVYSRAGELPREVREALVKAMGFKRAMVDTQRQLQEKHKEVAEITQEQQRIRENMRTVSSSSQYHARLLSKLNEQETKIETLQAEIEQLKRTHDQQRQELETYLINTTVG